MAPSFGLSRPRRRRRSGRGGARRGRKAGECSIGPVQAGWPSARWGRRSRARPPTAVLAGGRACARRPRAAGRGAARSSPSRGRSSRSARSSRPARRPSTRPSPRRARSETSPGACTSTAGGRRADATRRSSADSPTERLKSEARSGKRRRRRQRGRARRSTGSRARRRSRRSRGFDMNPVSTRIAGTLAQLKPVRSLRSLRPRSRAPVAATSRALHRPRSAQARRVDVVRPAAAQGGVERRDSRASSNRSSRPRGCGA